MPSAADSSTLPPGLPTAPGVPDPQRRFVGVFPVTTTMLEKRKALGYREIRFREDCILGSKGETARGHEFHYSQMAELPQEFTRLYQVSRMQHDLGTEGYRYKNCLASYIHLHFGSNPGMAAAFVESCRKYLTRRNRWAGAFRMARIEHARAGIDLQDEAVCTMRRLLLLPGGGKLFAGDLHEEKS